MDILISDNLPIRANYKLKIDGFHLVGTRQKLEKKFKKLSKDKLKEIFDVAYKESLELSLKGEEQIFFINEKMKELYKSSFVFEDLIELANFESDFSEYIREKLKQKSINLIMRRKRFKQKANLHCWNYFVTQTYDSSKWENEEDFKRAYLTCLSHLSTEYGWRYMGVWEKGSKTGRLHFHGVFYIPQGSMKGFLKESKYFNFIKKRFEKSMINSFFAVRFGRNDFQRLSSDISGVVNYIIKYITKTEDKIVYSRHIDDCIEMELNQKDFSIGYALSFCKKYVLHDDLLLNTILNPETKRGVFEPPSVYLIT